MVKQARQAHTAGSHLSQDRPGGQRVHQGPGRPVGRRDQEPVRQDTSSACTGDKYRCQPRILFSTTAVPAAISDLELPRRSPALHGRQLPHQPGRRVRRLHRQTGRHRSRP
ncbi:MAG: hypothetical protein MZV70_37280 [Desulfobacterales bacterium]|nr:hypothetical protein [Desulfobacterales bacterium]